jgi:hypothetical protein
MVAVWFRSVVAGGSSAIRMGSTATTSNGAPTSIRGTLTSASIVATDTTVCFWMSTRRVPTMVPDSMVGRITWQGYYGGYFQPYPVYPSAASWLTDYMISQDLQADYAAHQDGGEVDSAQQASGRGPALTPDVKQQIADEVRGELALENAEAAQTAQHQDVDPNSSGIARIMADGRSHVFVVGDAMDLVDANGNECAISDGDALLLQTPPSADPTAATLVVLAS